MPLDVREALLAIWQEIAMGTHACTTERERRGLGGGAENSF